MIKSSLLKGTGAEKQREELLKLWFVLYQPCFSELRIYSTSIRRIWWSERFLRSLVFYSGFSVEFAVLVQARMLLNDDEIVQSFLGKDFMLTNLQSL